MKKQLVTALLGAISLMCLVGCTPDDLKLDVYTADLAEVKSGKVIEVPCTITFSMTGEDDSNELPQAARMAQRYLGAAAEFKITERDFDTAMVVKCTVPMGTEQAINAYLLKKPIPIALYVTATEGGGIVRLEKTKYLSQLNSDLTDISYMLGAELPASQTVVRITGDQVKAPEVGAIAVFVDKQAELIYKDTIERRTSVEIVYKGDDASVYSEVEPVFTFEFPETSTHVF